MATRIPWDKEEAAILIDAYSRVKQKKISRADAVSEVSYILRHRGANLGYNIDEVYRNENGISMQMTIIGGLVDGSPSTLHKASSLFVNMVNLYKNDKPEFNRILSEAKSECGIHSNIQEEFFAWLSEQVSPMQLSELYMAYLDIESFCLKANILKSSLFDISDLKVLEEVREAISKNKNYRNKYSRQYEKMVSAISYYVFFIQNVYPGLIGNDLKKSGHFLERNNSSSNIASSFDNTDEKICKSSNYDKNPFQQELSQDCSQEKDILIRWDFASDDLDFECVIPISVEYFGEGVACNGWLDAYAKIINILNDDYPSILHKFVVNRSSMHGEVILTDKKDLSQKSQYIHVDNGLYLNINFQPKEIIEIIRDILDNCNLDYENVVIKYTVQSKSYEKVLDTKNSEDEERLNKNYISNTKDDSSLFINFNSIGNMAYTYPIALEYKGERVECHSWSNLYVVLISKLRSEYKDIFDEKKDKAVFHTSGIMIASESKKDKFAKPKNIGGDLYIETNRSATQIVQNIRSFLELCNIDYSSVYIEYLKNESIKNLSKTEINSEEPINIINEDPQHKQSFSKIYLGNKEVLRSSSLTKSKDLTNCSANAMYIDRFSKILNNNFPDGFRPDSLIDRNRFRVFYSDLYNNEELKEDDNTIISVLTEIGSLRDGRIFIRNSDNQIDLIEKINKTIDDTLKGDASCIYLECLFDKYQIELAEKLHLYSKNALSDILLSFNNTLHVSKNYDYIFCDYRQPDISKDIINYIKKSVVPVTYSKLKEALWYIPFNKIKRILNSKPEIVNVAPESYLWIYNFPATEAELLKITTAVEKKLLQRRYISDTELKQIIDESCPSLIINTAEYPNWGLRNALAYILKDKFSFKGPIISNKGEEISMSEVFADFCKSNDQVTVEDLRRLSNELNTGIYWDVVYKETIRISENKFVRKDKIKFKIYQTDNILEELISDEYIPIEKINLFLDFPTIGLRWNRFILESYVANYSQKFILLHTGFTRSGCYGAIVRKDSKIKDYHSLIVDVLSKDTSWHNIDEALQILVENGYQHRKYYSDIDNVILEAKDKMMKQNNEN